MSRLFEALQKSEPELSFEFPLAMQLTDELLTPAETAQEESEEFEPSLRGKQDVDVAPELDQSIPSVPVTIKPDARLVCLTEKDSLAAEKFRFLAVRLRQLQQTRAVKKLLVTSTIPEEGKSMISANLALSLARKKRQRVLLIEGDLRRPTLYKSFGLTRLPGASEWLKSGSSEVRNIYHIEEAGLWSILHPCCRSPIPAFGAGWRMAFCWLRAKVRPENASCSEAWIHLITRSCWDWC